MVRSEAVRRIPHEAVALLVAWAPLAAGSGPLLALLGASSACAEEAGPAPAKAPARAPSARPSAKGSPLPTWFAFTLAHSEIGINVAYFWSKGPKLRAETVIGGLKVVSIVNGETYYAYDDVSREGVAIGRSSAAIAKDAPDRRPFGRELEIILDQGGEKVGEEEVGGRLCERYRVTDAAGRREVWVTKDALRLPVRLEIYTRPTGKTVHTDFVNWTSALPIDDAFFEPEPGIRFQRLSYEEYAARQFTPVGPVPILYMDLLTGR
jgi:hypothetical protein